jgi:molecular chaperone DnaK
MESEKNMLTVGLDFGTTNTVISYYNKNPTIFKDSIKESIPTKIYFDNNKILCGNYIPVELTSTSKNILSNFKTKIGNNLEFYHNNKLYKENEIILIFFSHLKNLLLIKFPNTEFNVVLTIPSNFNDNQRKILLTISKKVGFNIIRIINEPTAAAFAYGLNNDIDEEKIMVFDIGGGTLDMTILEIDGNFFETIDSVGVNDLGGNDFTNAIYNDCLKNFKLNNIKNDTDILISKSKLIQLLYKCNQAKEKLYWVDSCQVIVKDFYKTSKESIDLEYNLDNSKFKTISKDLLDRIKRKISSFKNKYQINKLILVGGTSKLKIIQELLYDEFKIKPTVHNKLQHVVSLGACYYGALIQKELSNDDIILVDNLHLSLGIETAEGQFSIIIPKNTPLPVKRSQKYTIDTPGEEVVTVKVYQGERSIASKNYLIGEFEFNKISKIGLPIINITFKVDINGIINISIEDKHSGKSKDILIRNINDDIESNLENILKDANENKDIDEKELVKNQLFYKLEIRIETILNNIKNNNLISKEKKDEMTGNLIDNLENLSNKTIPELIKLDKEIDDNYFIISNNSLETSENDSSYQKELNIEDTIMKEKIEFLKSKIDFYSTKDISEFQRECLLKVSNFMENDNINQLDIYEKTEYVKELFKENDKDELVQLCLFLKNELENFNLDISNEQYVMLSNIVTKYLKMLNDDNYNSKEINFKNEINNLNKICENLTKNK